VAKLAADEPDAHGGVVQFQGQVRKRKFPLPRSLANVKRGLRRSGRRPRAGPRRGSIKPRTASTALVKSRSRIRRWHVPTSALPPASTSSRRGTVTGHCSTLRGPLDVRTPAIGCASIKFRLVSIYLRSARNGKANKKTLWATVLEETRKLPGGIQPSEDGQGGRMENSLQDPLWTL